jgi:signal transduction histidine kinase
VDVPLALIAFGGTVAIIAHGHPSPRHGATLGLLLAAVASLPLLGWRRAPLTVFVVTLLGSAALMSLGYPGAPPVGATIALYLVATTRDAAHPWSRPLAGLVAVLFAVHFAAFAVGHGDQLPLLEVGIGALVWALAWFAGERTRLRRSELAELEQRAVRAEREAQRERRLALAEERARIARDLHDSAAHAVNVIAVQAGAARLHLQSDPTRSHAALETIEEVARRTVTEIDQIVHGLRERAAAGEPDQPVEPIEPPPGMAALDSLLHQHRDAGLGVTMHTSGARRPLGPSVDRAAYRILQEALTNSARHGAGGAEISVSYGERALELMVANRTRADLTERPTGGHGLVGMRERAALLGGELRAGRQNGHFEVRARLPYGVGT